jgi:hypothetical protein
MQSIVHRLSNLFPVTTTMNDKTYSADLALSDSAKELLEESLAELKIEQRGSAKAVIKQRLEEIARLEFLLTKARKDLAELLKKEPEEIRMIGDGFGRTGGRF